MKRFVEEYPEFRKLGGNVSKHVAIVGELSRLVGHDKLLDIGEVEQGLATGSGADLRSVQALITNPAIQPWNKLRLVMLYALRYQKSQAQNVASLINLMLENGVSREDARVRLSLAHSSMCAKLSAACLRIVEHRGLGPATRGPVLRRGTVGKRTLSTQGSQGGRECLHAAYPSFVTNTGKPVQRSTTGYHPPLP